MMAECKCALFGQYITRPTAINTNTAAIPSRDSARQRLLCCTKSFQVADFGTNRKLVYHFLLVNDTNLRPISHCFQIIEQH